MSNTYFNILTKGLQADLDKSTIVDGKLRFTEDTKRLYLDKAPKGGTPERIKISDIIDDYTEAQIFELTNPLTKIYLSTDTHRAFVAANGEWIDLAEVQLSVADVKDLDVPIWFSETDDVAPEYSTDLTYNTSTKEFKVPNVKASNSIVVGNMKITDTVDASNSHTVEFSFITA